MKKVNFFFLGVVIICLVVSGIILAQGCSTSPVYTEEDASAVIAVKKGALFVIDLEENPSTGFSWHYTVSDEKVAALDADHFTAPDSGEQLTGSPGRRQFQFRAGAGGSAAITFEYYREWEPANIAETYRFTVEVE
ncbi:MAG: protease inhibitor I42 family protein [Bacillota bacterium]